MKSIIAVLALALVGALGYWGWERHQSSLELEAALSNVRSTTALLSKQSEMRKSDTITFAEYFKRTEESIDDLDKGILVLRTSKFSHQASARDSAIDFASNAQEMIRSDASHARSSMREKNAERIAKEAHQEAMSSSNEYTIKWASERSSKARNEQIEILGEMIKELEGMKVKNERMIDSDRKIKDIFGANEGLPPEMLSKLTPEKPKS